MKIAFIDLETTGLDPKRHGVWSIGAILEIDGEVVETLDLRCQPIHGTDLLSKEALRVGKVTKKDLLAFPEAQVTKEKLGKVLEKYIDPTDRTDQFHLVGYNAQFDYSFLRAWFEKLGDPYFFRWFWHPPIDVMNLCALYCMGGRAQVQSFKLAKIAYQIGGIQPEKSHEAMADIELTRALFYMLKREAYSAWKNQPITYRTEP